MQTISLKQGFENVFTAKILDIISQENDFIYLDSNELNISYNLDKGDMYD